MRSVLLIVAYLTVVSATCFDAQMDWGGRFSALPGAPVSEQCSAIADWATAFSAAPFPPSSPAITQSQVCAMTLSSLASTWNAAVTSGTAYVPPAGFNTVADVCQASCGACTAPPNPLWTVTGPCPITQNGVCFTSTNFMSGAYGNSESCVATIQTTGFVMPTFFRTEANYDFVTMGGVQYSGLYSNPIPPATAPGSASLAIPTGTLSTGTTINWSSDDGVQEVGFEICVSTSPPMPPSPPPAPSPLCRFTISSRR